MNKEKFDLLEVRAKKEGRYLVTLYQFERIVEKDQDYISEWLYFDGEKWDYGVYEGTCYVCFIHDKE